MVINKQTMKKVTTLLLAVVIIAGCEKKSSNNNTSSSTQSATTTGGTTTGGTPSQSRGLMHVSNSQGSGSAVAHFYDANGAMMNVGTVKINDTLVPMYSGPSYVLSTMYNFNTMPVWKISGGNGVPPTIIAAKQIPFYPSITANNTIYETQPFTFTHTPAFCDSIFYAFGNYTLMTIGTNTSITIPATAVVTTNTWQTTVGASMLLCNYHLQIIGTIPCNIASSFRRNTNFPYQQ